MFWTGQHADYRWAFWHRMTGSFCSPNACVIHCTIVVDCHFRIMHEMTARSIFAHSDGMESLTWFGLVFRMTLIGTDLVRTMRVSTIISVYTFTGILKTTAQLRLEAVRIKLDKYFNNSNRNVVLGNFTHCKLLIMMIEYTHFKNSALLAASVGLPH